jgi:hypothetical protein
MLDEVHRLGTVPAVLFGAMAEKIGRCFTDTGDEFFLHLRFRFARLIWQLYDDRPHP